MSKKKLVDKNFDCYLTALNYRNSEYCLFKHLRFNFNKSMAALKGRI